MFKYTKYEHVLNFRNKRIHKWTMYLYTFLGLCGYLFFLYLMSVYNDVARDCKYCLEINNQSGIMIATILSVIYIVGWVYIERYPERIIYFFQIKGGVWNYIRERKREDEAEIELSAKIEHHRRIENQKRIEEIREDGWYKQEYGTTKIEHKKQRAQEMLDDKIFEIESHFENLNSERRWRKLKRLKLYFILRDHKKSRNL